MELKRVESLDRPDGLPDTWRVLRLENCVRADSPICYGILIPGSHYDGGVAVVKVRDIVNGRIDETRLLLTRPSIDESYSRSRLRVGDIVITIRGTTGRVALVPSSLNGANITQDTARIRVLSTLDARFIYYALQSEGVQREVALQTIGQAVKGINIRDVKRIAIAVPRDLDEQEAISTALGDVDATLDRLDLLIAKKRGIRQAAVQQLLTGQTRLPGFSGEWEVRRLGDCLLSPPDYGINAAASAFSDQYPTYIRITDISEDGRFCPRPRVSVAAANSNQYRLSDGDVVFARTGASVGKSYLYDRRDGELVFAGFLIRVRPNPELLLPAYLAGYTTSKPYWDWVRLMSMRSGQPGINGNEFSQMLLRLPGQDEQTAIVAVLSDMDAELLALEARRDKTRALKQAMMQELLTGRTRLI